MASPGDTVPRIAVRISGRNRLLCEALVRLLRKRTGFSVQATHPGANGGMNAGNDSTETVPCDVLLADSLEECRATHEEGRVTDAKQSSHLLLFGMDEDPERFLDAIRFGVSGYLLNDASSEDIVQAIKMVARGEAVCPPRLCMFLFHHVSSVCGRVSSGNEDAGGRMKNLTMRQRQLMDLVSKGLSNKEIAARLNLSQFTVKNHIRRVLQHVEVETRHQAVDLMRAGGILPLA